MVDKDKIKDRKKKSGGKKKKGSSGSGSSDSGSSTRTRDTTSKSSGSAPEPHRTTMDDVPDVEESGVPGISKEWAEKGGELNYKVQNGEPERKYVQRQIEECAEFYDNYWDTVKGNMESLEEFVLYHHALNISFAQNRVGIIEVLMDEFGYDRDDAVRKTKQICEEAGEMETMKKVMNKLMFRLLEG